MGKGQLAKQASNHAQQQPASLDQLCACSTRSSRTACAFLAFPEHEALLKFGTAFHGRAFISDRGAQFRCTVEYAPCQKVPKQRSKVDSREGTLDEGTSFAAASSCMPSLVHACVETHPCMLQSAGSVQAHAVLGSQMQTIWPSWSSLLRSPHP